MFLNKHSKHFIIQMRTIRIAIIKSFERGEIDYPEFLKRAEEYDNLLIIEHKKYLIKCFGEDIY